MMRQAAAAAAFSFLTNKMLQILQNVLSKLVLLHTGEANATRMRITSEESTLQSCNVVLHTDPLRQSVRKQSLAWRQCNAHHMQLQATSPAGEEREVDAADCRTRHRGSDGQVGGIGNVDARCGYNGDVCRANQLSGGVSSKSDGERAGGAGGGSQRQRG